MVDISIKNTGFCRNKPVRNKNVSGISIDRFGGIDAMVLNKDLMQSFYIIGAGITDFVPIHY